MNNSSLIAHHIGAKRVGKVQAGGMGKLRCLFVVREAMAPLPEPSPEELCRLRFFAGCSFQFFPHQL